jgi:hypothetical protein
MQKVSTDPVARHKTRTFTSSLVRYLMLSCASLLPCSCSLFVLHKVKIPAGIVGKLHRTFGAVAVANDENEWGEEANHLKVSAYLLGVPSLLCFAVVFFHGVAIPVCKNVGQYLTVHHGASRSKVRACRDIRGSFFIYLPNLP